MQHVDPNFNTAAQGNADLRLDTMEAPKRRGPRFAGLPLDRADAVTLLLFAEALCRLYDELTERHFGRPIGSELTTEIRAIIERAEQAAKVEVLQILGETAA